MKNTQLGDALKKDRTPKGFHSQGVPWTTADSALRCHHSCKFSTCESLHAFYFYVKQFCVLIKVNQWRCQQWDGMGMSLSTFHPLTQAFL